MEATKITTTEARSGSYYGARNIFRRSIYTFLQNYHWFTSTAAFIALPFSASVLLSQSSSSVLPSIHGRLEALFVGAGFPSSGLLSILILKLSQTISSSVLTIPFGLTFLLLAKAAVLNTLQTNDDDGHLKAKAKTAGLSSIYYPLLHTSLWNTVLIISANATAFCILFLALNIFQGLNALLLVALGAVLYSIILANALIISNLALVVAGVAGRGGYMPILKACVLIRGRTSTALSLAVPITLAMAAIEALFQFRARHHDHQQPALFVAIEPLLIAYMHSIVALLGTIVSYLFLNTCNKAMDQQIQQSLDSINV